MEKEIITNKQAICIMSMFIMGSSLVLGAGTEAKQDVWIAILFGIAIAVPVLMVYARILALFPEKDLFQILQIIFGKILGKIIAMLFIWYAFHLGALVTRNFTEFIKLAAMPETPEIVPTLLLGLLCIWGVKEGIEVLGRWSQFVLPLLLGIIFVVAILSMTLADFDNIRPVMYKNLEPIMSSVFSTFTFPLAETVVFMMVGNVVKQEKSNYKIYMISLLLGGGIVLLVSVRNVLVMGASFISSTYFPSYAAVSLINIGDFLQRIEIMVSVVFIFAGFIKICICLLASSKGIANLFNIKEYRLIVAPIGLLMLSLSYIIYDNIMEMNDWAFKIYKFYALPFQVFLPLLIWVVAEIKVKKGAEKESA